MDNTEINGYQNEIMFAKNLNGKKIKYLYPNLQDLVIELFGFVNFNSVIYSWVDFSKKKYDIIMEVDSNQIKNNLPQSHISIPSFNQIRESK